MGNTQTPIQNQGYGRDENNKKCKKLINAVAKKPSHIRLQQGIDLPRLDLLYLI